ncbi:hypothetical protein HPB47_019553 [Ixodes persulcatus]|uniref:Uncharacterized protein n=1 Tax=Ixodes persulcatus TaxID=34615 RepID=A0AC60QK44_IXOPE|nr:hypothetical protein HPB47_019553 [Ixodes persulcatus]
MPYQEVTSGKRKRCRDIDTKSKLTDGLVVLFTPADPTVSVESINSLRLSDTFQELAPSCIIELELRSTRVTEARLIYPSKPCKHPQQRLETLPPRTSHGIRDVPDVARQTTDNHHRKILLKRRQHLLLNPVDVLAIQEPLTRPGDFRLSPYVIYSSAPALANGRSRALLLVKAGLLLSHVDPSTFILRGLERTQYHMGDNRITPRGSALEDVTTSLGLEALNDGSETFVRQGVHGSVLDLTFAPRDIAASWSVMADTWGSDHVPIMVVSPHTRTRKPAPDLEYLNLRAARRRAQRKARRTNIAADWQHHRKIDAKFRRHTTRLQLKRLLMQCRQLLGLLRKFRAHSQQGLPPNGLLTLYKGLIKSKFLYSLPLANIRGPQRDQLERFHRVALRLCLGLPSNSPNIPTLVEAREQPLFLKGEESSKMHLIRIHVALSTDYLLMNLHSRSSSHFGRIAAEFTNEIGDPGPRFPIRPPHSTQPPLNVQRSLPDVRARKDLHPVVARTAVAVALEEKYASSLEIYTDGSVNKSAGTATAAYVIPSIGKEHAVRINIETSSTTAEMVAILLALEYLGNTEWMTAAVILTDSRTALRNLANAGEGSLLAQETAHLATTLQERGWTLAFQWVPAHSGIVGNERADTLAKNAHALPSPTYHLRPFHEARLLIARNIRSRHPDPSTARGTPPIPVPDSRLTRADASLLHRLWTGSAFTRLALHRYGRARRGDSPECTVCGDPEDITHILLICPEYDAARKGLFATVLKAGGQTATTTCLLFPTGSRRQAWSIFRAVLEFLHQTELAERL